MGYRGLTFLYARGNLVTMYAFSQDPKGRIRSLLFPIDYLEKIEPCQYL